MGIGTHNIYTQVAPHKALIMQAFASTGEDPWLEGGPDPRKAKADAECTSGDDCRSGQCHERVCVNPCGEGDTCDDGYTCAGGDEKVCLTSVVSEALPDNAAAGCSAVGGGGIGTGSGAVLVGASMLLFTGLRRRNARKVRG